jgi:hypothetical protein
MKSGTNFFLFLHILILFSLVVLVGCMTPSTSIVKPTFTSITTASATTALISTLTSIPSETPTPTNDPAYLAWHATAIGIYESQETARWQAWDEISTQVAGFPLSCEVIDRWSSSISPDGNWFASSCSGYLDQKLVVVNKEGAKWVLTFEDFLPPEKDKDARGSLDPKFWSPGGEYLYFTSHLGYSGGGSQCMYTFNGAYGLFRLNLNTGSWNTLLSANDNFPGDQILFSPTGKYYAASINGVTITVLKTGESFNTKIPGVMQLSWSPDGMHLVYSVAKCGEFFVKTSSIYIWDVETNQTRTLITVDGILLNPESWIDNSTLRILGEKWDVKPEMMIIYEFDIIQGRQTFSETVTPSP